MQITISYSGVEDHLDRISEELRSIHLFQDKLRSLASQAAELGADPEPFLRCAGLMESVENSARFRKETLEQLIADMKQAEAEISDIVWRLERKTSERIGVSGRR